MSRFDVSSLAAGADLLALAERDTTLRRVSSTLGGEYQGPCPFCGGEDRFRVQPNGGADGRGRWACRVCEPKGGDVIAYIQRRQGCDFAEACRVLGAVEALPVRHKATPPTPAPSGPPDSTWQDKAQQAVEILERNLWTEQAARALDWLHKRGLTDETLKRFRVGYLPGGASGWGNVAGLSVACGIVIPGIVGGEVWYIKTRRAAGEPKYTQVKGGRPALFGADTLRGKQSAVLCEGEFDAMLLWQFAGDLVGVATFGSAGGKRIDFGPWGASLLPLSRLWVAYDADPAGELGAAGIVALTNRARLATVPREAKDLTDAWLAGADLRQWILDTIGEKAQPIASTSAAVATIPTQPDDTQPDDTLGAEVGGDDFGDPFAGEPFNPAEVATMPDPLPQKVTVATMPPDLLPQYLVEFLAETGNEVAGRVGDRLTITAIPTRSIFEELLRRGHKPTLESIDDYAHNIAAAAIREGRYGEGYYLSSPAEWLAWADGIKARYCPSPATQAEQRENENDQTM